MRWPTVPLGAVADINPRNREWAAFPDETDVTFVPMPAVSEWTASISEPETRTLGQVRRGYTPFLEGDLLFAKITPCMENGKAALAEGLMNGLGFGSTEFHVLRPGRVILPKYLLYFVRQQSFRNAAKQRMQGAVGQQRVPEDFLRTFPIPLPPLSEQRQIREILDQADALRKRRAEADDKAERILPSLFNKMFGDPATNPKSWEIIKLSDLVMELRYGTSTRCSAEPNDLPVLRIPNILRGEVDLGDLKYAELPAQEANRLLLQYGDLLFVRTNGNRDYVGRCAIFDLDAPYLFASYLIRARLQQDRVDP
jgi:type I restriction enzyme S subunit